MGGFSQLDVCDVRGGREDGRRGLEDVGAAVAALGAAAVWSGVKERAVARTVGERSYPSYG